MEGVSLCQKTLIGIVGVDKRTKLIFAPTVEKKDHTIYGFVIAQP